MLGQDQFFFFILFFECSQEWQIYSYIHILDSSITIGTKQKQTVDKKGRIVFLCILKRDYKRRYTHTHTHIFRIKNQPFVIKTKWKEWCWWKKITFLISSVEKKVFFFCLGPPQRTFIAPYEPTPITQQYL